MSRLPAVARGYDGQARACATAIALRHPAKDCPFANVTGGCGWNFGFADSDHVLGQANPTRMPILPQPRAPRAAVSISSNPRWAISTYHYNKALRR